MHRLDTGHMVPPAQLSWLHKVRDGSRVGWGYVSQRFLELVPKEV